MVKQELTMTNFMNKRLTLINRLMDTDEDVSDTVSCVIEYICSKGVTEERNLCNKFAKHEIKKNGYH